MSDEIKAYEPPKYHHCGADECTCHEWMTNLVDDLDSITAQLGEALTNRRKPEFVAEVYSIQEKLYELLRKHNHIQDGTWAGE